MTEESPRSPSYVIVMGDADRDLLDALKDRRGSIQSHILEARGVDDAVESILRARPDLAVVPEDLQGQSHVELCQRIKQLNPRIATVVLRAVLTDIPAGHAAIDDYVALGDNDDMMSRINVLLRLRTFNARALPIRDRILAAFRAFDLSPRLLADGRLLPPSKVDFRALLDVDDIREHEAALSKLGYTSFACHAYASQPEVVCTSAAGGCLRGVCPVAQALSSEPGFTVACDDCHLSAWRCARDAMLAGEPRTALCPGGYQIAAFPVCLTFRSVRYPLLAICISLPSALDLDQLDRLAEQCHADPVRLRREVALRPLPRLSRVHLDALLLIEQNVTEAYSHRVSDEYATAYNVLVEAVERWEHNRSLSRRSLQLQRANERLRELSHLRGEFLANLSHELRTPMTSIIGFTSLLLREAAGQPPERAAHFLNQVLANARTLEAAINDVLDLAQLGSPDAPVEPTTFELAPLVRQCLEAARHAIGDKPIALHTDLPPGLPPLETDRERLRKILLSLLSNAAKFTSQGEIRVAARALEEAGLPRVAIAVADTGVGLPADALPHIFEEFRQVDGSSTRRYGGAGVGLSLVKKLCRLLGGEVAVDSRPNEGSTFTVTVPTNLRRFQRQRQQLRDEALAAEPDPDDHTSPIVLVVADDPRLVLDLRRWAAPHGYRVAAAFSYDDALDRARAILPYAVLVDVDVPGQEVWELADELRADPRTTDTTLIVAAPGCAAAVAESAGASELLSKPVDRDAFLNALDYLQASAAATVLVIVPDPAERDRIRCALRDAAYRAVACAACGDASRFAEPPFDVIVVDPEAPGQGALTALGTLRAAPWAADTPVVAYLTPHCPHDARQQADALAAVVERTDRGPTHLVEAIARLLADTSPPDDLDSW